MIKKRKQNNQWCNIDGFVHDGSFPAEKIENDESNEIFETTGTNSLKTFLGSEMTR